MSELSDIFSGIAKGLLKAMEDARLVDPKVKEQMEEAKKDYDQQRQDCSVNGGAGYNQNNGNK